jgi:hypothetical protein
MSKSCGSDLKTNRSKKEALGTTDFQQSYKGIEWGKDKHLTNSAGRLHFHSQKKELTPPPHAKLNSG